MLTTQAPISPIRPDDIAPDAIELVRRWLRDAAQIPVDPSAARLADILKDPGGLAYTVGFVDGVIRPEDPAAAAKKLAELAPLTPRFLSPLLRAAGRLGGVLARPLPGLVVPVARKVLRQMVGHLIIDATDSKLGSALAKIAREGVRLNINLLGEAILGQREAQRRLEGTRALLARDDVDYVSIKVSSTVAPHNHWAYEEAVGNVVTQLVPLFELAKSSTPHKFINLDMEEYKDLDITIDVFTAILDRPEFHDLAAGIVLQAYLPDALGAMMHLQQWAARRVEQGGAPIKVRVVKGANLPMEVVSARVNSWPLATWGTKQATDASYKAVLDYALHPERIGNVHIGVAGHNLFDIALAHLLAKARGIEEGIDVEMLLGMATGQAEVVRRDVGSLLLYTPVVHPQEFDVAIAYLIRRLEEGASTENFMSAVFDLGEDPALFEREKERFLASLADAEQFVRDGEHLPPAANRTQDRREYDEAGASARIAARLEAGRRGEFTNVANTDPDLTGNRQWGRAIAERMASSQLGVTEVAEAWLEEPAALEEVIQRGIAAAQGWQARSPEERAEILYAAAERLEARRADLLEVMGSECGKTLDQGDPEVSEAIDFANYYAMLGQQLERTRGAEFNPVKLTAVIPPWNFPVAIPAGGVLAALAAGSAVIIKPAADAARSGAVMVQALWEAGVPREVLQLVQLDNRTLGSRLVADPRIDRLILTGSYDTAAFFRSLRPDLPILAETSGKNAIIVTPSADLDLAARDVAASAFGHAGQKCSASSLVILVGSVATSERFHRQLLDAVASLKVGTPEDLESQMGPIITAPTGKLLRGLTTLGPGERWVLAPRPLDSPSPLGVDASGTTKVWTPGVRSGVQRGSEYHLTEYFGPILGVMTAATLAEAIELVNDIDYGLTSGLHSLDAAEIDQWLGAVQAGNLYVNRGITGAIVRRQSFGGWKKSAIGPGTKAGGPNYLHALGTWSDAPITGETRPPRPEAAGLLRAAEQAELPEADLAWLTAALGDDAAAWAEEFGIARDASGLEVERNILRYLPAPATIRIAVDAPLPRALRVIGAALAARSFPVVSVAAPFPAPIDAALAKAGLSAVVENESEWCSRLERIAAQEGPDASARIRLVAGTSREEQIAQIGAVTGGKVDIAVYGGPVVSSGRVEMLPYLREQAVSITAHRFGTPDPITDELI